MSFFDEVAFPWVVGIEKGYQCDPHDDGNWTGGKVGSGQLVGTKYGVTAASYPNLDIKNLTVPQAAAIAKADYWDKFQGDKMPKGVALSVFDFGYNAGIHEGIIVLQRALDLPEDGDIGPITLGMLAAKDPKWTIQTYYIERMMAYKQMADWVRYSTSWSNRAKTTRDKALTV